MRQATAGRLDASILHVGCGNSMLPEAMSEDQEKRVIPPGRHQKAFSGALVCDVCGFWLGLGGGMYIVQCKLMRIVYCKGLVVQLK